MYIQRNCIIIQDRPTWCSERNKCKSGGFERNKTSPLTFPKGLFFIYFISFSETYRGWCEFVFTRAAAGTARKRIWRRRRLKERGRGRREGIRSATREDVWKYLTIIQHWLYTMQAHSTRSNVRARWIASRGGHDWWTQRSTPTFAWTNSVPRRFVHCELI